VQFLRLSRDPTGGFADYLQCMRRGKLCSPILLELFAGQVDDDRLGIASSQQHVEQILWVTPRWMRHIRVQNGSGCAGAAGNSGRARGRCVP
jgi:hypothetical protein